MYRKKYVVLDVEINALYSLNYDLISISIYKLGDEKSYGKLLSLELTRDVYITYINV